MARLFFILNFAITLIQLLGSAPAMARQLFEDQEDTILLEDVTVSVLPFEESYDNATGSLFLLNRRSLDLQYMLTSADMINLVPGIHMATGSYNTNRLVIRGVGSRTPYNTNRIRAYLDDIPLTSGDGVSTVEDLDILGIGTMEILKGPSSALYGSGLGGVVRLNSSYPLKYGFTGSAFGEYGSFGTARYGITPQYKRENLAITGGITRTVSDGYRQNSNYSRNNAFLSVRYFRKRNIISMTASMVDLFAAIPSSLNESDFINEPWKAAGNWLQVKGFEEYTRFLAGINIESQPGTRLSNNLVLFSSMADPFESRPFNILDDRSLNIGLRESISFEMASWNFSTGIEYFHEWVDWQIYETINGNRGKLLVDQSEIRRQANLSTLIQWKPSEKLLMDGGVNVNMLDYQITTNYRADSTDQSGQFSYQPVISPRLGFSYKHHIYHHLYISAGHGFSAPSLEETLLPEGIINTDLKPETGWNMEVGNRGRLFDGMIHYDATLYAVFLKNLLVTERITEDQFYGANAGKTLNKGLELWVQLYLNKPDIPRLFNASARFAYAISDNRFLEFIDDGIDYSGKILPGIPRQKLNSILSVKLRSVQMKLNYQFNGSQWLNDANAQRYDGYNLLNFQISWKIDIPDRFSIIELKGGIRNLTGTRYASMILINAPAFGGNEPRYYYPGLPRQFHLGISINFDPPSFLAPSEYKVQ